MTCEEIIDADDHVIQTILFTLRNGKTVRWEEFSDRAEALEAAGLSE